MIGIDTVRGVWNDLWKVIGAVLLAGLIVGYIGLMILQNG